MDRFIQSSEVEFGDCMADDRLNPYSPLKAGVDERPSQRPYWPTVCLVVWFSGNFFLSFYVWFYSAAAEPHYGNVNQFSATLIMDGGRVALFLWALWSLILFFGVFRRWVSPLAILLLLVAIPGAFLCQAGMTLYLNDRATWRRMQTMQIIPRNVPSHGAARAEEGHTGDKP